MNYIIIAPLTAGRGLQFEIVDQSIKFAVAVMAVMPSRL